MFSDKVISIIGGAGSFGKTYAKILLQGCKPGKITIYSRDELKQFEVTGVFSAPCVRYPTGNVRDKEGLREAIKDADFIIHAAAMKRVSIAEYNPMECIKTNIHGAQNIIDVCFENDVKKCIALSTDRACNPVNLYGATKLVSDKLFVVANNMVRENYTRFSITRYGNVIGSRGSAVPFFKKFINRGASEFPITDVRMARFWTSLENDVKFVLENFKAMYGGEIFVPKVPLMKITGLAHTLAPKLKHRIISIRTEEKLREITISSDDSHLTYEFENYCVISPSIKFISTHTDFSASALGRKGQEVPNGFSYSSDNNPLWASEKEFLDIINEGF